MQAKLTINKTTKPFESGPHATLANQTKSSSAISIDKLERIAKDKRKVRKMYVITSITLKLKRNILQNSKRNFN